MSDQTKYTQKLKDTHVLIIGGSAGIGYGVAEASLESGARVTISSSQQTRVDAAISRLQSAYPSASSRIAGHACNLGDEATLEANIAALFDMVGSVDHVVFTAGDALAAMPIEAVDLQKIVKAGMVRFFAPLLVAKHAVKHLTPGPASSITLTTGSVSERPIANWTVVGSYAGGLHSMTRNLALDLKPIRVNLVSPGVVDTELWAGMDEAQKKAMFEGYEKVLPTGRVGQVEDVAEAYLYAMKDRNVTGTMISSNAGHLLVG
ncbi:hypothetical protein BJ546DRAFT_30780 [Cryomyces antarcticus]